MAGSPTYTSDTDLTSTYGTNETIQGNISIANSSANLLGKGTNFTTDLKVGDSITFTNDAGSSVTAKIQNMLFHKHKLH
jgi:co-chaperonin GroES (HSP10)